MKKILVIASYPQSLINFRGDFLLNLSLLGLEVHLASPGLTDDHFFLEDLNKLGFIAHDIPMSRAGLNPLTDINTFAHIAILLKNINPNYIFSYTIKPVIYGGLASYINSEPKFYPLVTGLGYTFLSRKSNSILFFIVKILYALALSKSKIVFFQNFDDEHLFRKLGILKPRTESLVLNGSGVNLIKFPYCSPESGNVIFLLIARLLRDKGIREYVAATTAIKKIYPHVIFRLAGDLDINPNSIERAELDSWVNAGSIEYLGFLPDVRPAITSCSVYVLPSYREGTPRSVLEAMSMGRPIITTDAPGCRETVIEGENGFLVPVKDVDALVKAMERFILDPSLIPKMGKRSREIAEEKYDVHKVNAVMLDAMGIT